MNKMFVTSASVFELNEQRQQEIEPPSLMEEGLFTDGNLFVRFDGSPFKGHYHLYRSGVYMSGFSPDPNDASSKNTYPSPDDADWHIRLYKASERRPSTITPSIEFYNNILKTAIPTLMQIIDNPAGETYFLTSGPREASANPYKILAGISFYISAFDSIVAVNEISSYVSEIADNMIVAFFQRHYYDVLDNEIKNALDSEDTTSAKIAALSRSYVITPAGFSNTLLYQEGSIYKRYNFEIKNIIKGHGHLKVNLEFGKPFLDSGKPQIIYSFLQTSQDRQKYFGVRDIEQFNKEFVKTDFYRSIMRAKEGRQSFSKNIINKTVKTSKLQLVLQGADMMAPSIDLLIALVYERDVFVFHSSVCSPRAYLHPTADLIESRPLSLPPRAKYPLNMEIDNISRLYCSYTSEDAAAAFFGMNIQNVIQNTLLFPGAFNLKDLDLYINTPILMQKTISDKNRSMTCDVPLENLGEYIVSKPLKLYSFKIESAAKDERAIVYYGASISLEKNKKYKFAFRALLKDHSIEAAKRLRRKVSSMINLLNETFSASTMVIDPIYSPAGAIDPIYATATPRTDNFQLKFLIDLILKLKMFYRGAPDKIFYLDKVLKLNYALTCETAAVVRKSLEFVIEDINAALADVAGRKRNQTTWLSFPAPRNITYIEKEFTKTVSSYKRKRLLKLPRANVAAMPIGRLEDLPATVYTGTTVDRTVTATAAPEKDLPLMKSFEKEYIYEDPLVKTSLEKYAPNYKLTACSQTFGVKYSMADLREIAYNAQENSIYLEILEQHAQLQNNTNIQNDLANSTLVTSPNFVPLSDYYDPNGETYSLESGNYLIKMNNPNYSYNNYFLLVI